MCSMLRDCSYKKQYVASANYKALQNCRNRYKHGNNCKYLIDMKKYFKTYKVFNDIIQKATILY